MRYGNGFPRRRRPAETRSGLTYAGIHLQSTPEHVWRALTDAYLSARYWGHGNVSDWRPGARWEHRRIDASGIADVVGAVLEATPPRRLVLTFGAPGGDGPRARPR